MLPIPTLEVKIPILFWPLFITYTSSEFCPIWGTLNSLTSGVVPTSNLLAPFLLFNVTFWPVLNGWFGIWIVLVGIDTVSFISPIILSTFIAPPEVVPTPTDWIPLKYIISSTSDSNLVVSTGILILLFNTSMLEPKVCAIPVCLNTLITFLNGYKFNTLKDSTSEVFPEPTLNEPPIAIVFGISVTKISWIKPLAAPTVIDFARPIVSVLTPTLNELVKFTIELLKPDIETEVWSFNSIKGK